MYFKISLVSSVTKWKAIEQLNQKLNLQPPPLALITKPIVVLIRKLQ